MKITFDSNVWRIIASPDTFPNESSIESFKQIRKAIDENRSTPFLCETVFTLEAIKRKDRKEFFSEYKPKVNISEQDQGEGINVSFSIGPDKSAHPGNNSYLEKHLNDAIAIGFQIIKLPRIGGIVNPDIESNFYQHNDLKAYQDMVFKVAREIESNGAGISRIQALGKKYDSQWTRGIEKAPEHENGNIAKAIAEWADGDSVACHIAVNGDYFCSRDNAHKAGDTSVFSESNLGWLKSNYGFRLISPEDLAEKLKIST
ncbi:hypothetical protein [Desulfobotulus mexicanus]|uniref:Uncharacterized protein n=1 Tax=Desulfobotulus mexicanus TaxID=2586642 RepID=A0A5S5MEA7_9BACT|nr:hypothetical protein [Desulfobotulus mexicanus]TYT74052.1 hypothetical protein FIM25_11600 [Desulfobotulus mexicanus]